MANRFAKYAQPQVIAPLSPQAPYQGPQAAANLTRTQQEIRQADATAASNAAEAAARAKSAQIKAKQDQEAYDSAHPKGSNATALGADSLKGLSVPDQELVKALADGRLAFPSGFALKAPWWQQKLEQVAAYDPSFDATNYNNRAKARASLINGKLGTSANALNTAIGHVGLLNDQIPGTASHDWTDLNAVENYLSRKFGSPGVTNYNNTAGKLASEETSVYRNGGGAEQDVARYLKNHDPNASLEQKQGDIRNTLELFASKQAANLYQYNLSSGGKPTVDLLDPAARAVLDKFPDIRDKYFDKPVAPLSREAAALVTKNGGTPPSGGGGYTPPPTGSNNSGLGASNNGYNETPNPQADAFWESEAKQGVPYRQALKDARTDASARGNSVVTPPDPSAYAKASEYMRNNKSVDYHPFQAVTRTPLSGVSAFANDVAQNPGGAFAGHYINNLNAQLPALAAGDQGQYFNAVSRQQNPKASALGDLLGTVGGAVLTGKALGAVAPSLGNLGQFLTKTPLRQGLIGDVAFGTGSGAAGNPDNPALGAAVGGGSMLAGNMLGRYVAGPALAAAGDTAAGQAVVNGVNKINPFNRGGGSFSPPAPLNAGQSAIVNQPGIADIQSNMQSAADLGLPYALADAHPKLRLLAGSATRKSPDVRTMAEQVIGPRQLGQGERAIAQINNNLAPVGDVPTMQANTLKSAQAQSGPLYDAAKSQPVPELTANPALKEVLDRPSAQAAIRKGYEKALDNGEDVGTLTYATDPNGQTVQYGNPSWNVIHYARKALDANGDTAVRQALDKQIAGINPAFKKADAAYSSVMKGSDALQAGADATGIKVTPEATQQALASFPNNATQFQQGYASNMADMVERQRLSGNPYDLVNGSLGQQAKLNTVFPQGAPNFNRAQGLEGDMSKTAYETLGGSPTQGRAESDKLFDASTAADLGSLALGGPPSGATAVKLLTWLKNKGVDNYRLGLGKSKADSIGPMLLNTDPQANLMTLADLVKAQAARQQYVNRARTLGSLAGAPLTFGLIQNR